VAAANPHTIVTVTGAWERIRAAGWTRCPCCCRYYPGQEGGTAVADVLFGKHNPEGKLPVSFDRSWEESPSHDYYYRWRARIMRCT